MEKVPDVKNAASELGVPKIGKQLKWVHLIYKRIRLFIDNVVALNDYHWLKRIIHIYI
jgi:hypothetical protein